MRGEPLKPVPAGSCVKVVALKDGCFAVATYWHYSPGLFQMRGRWFCKNHGEALLHAQLWQAKGYELRSEGGQE